MLKLRKGCKVPFPEKLSEGYMHRGNCLIANVDEDKIEQLLTHFIMLHKEPVFFILEIPSQKNHEAEIRPGVVEKFHRDVYYVDGCTQKEALQILSKIVSILINDGMSSFGFGGHESHDEIMVGKYNVVSVYTRNKKTFEGFFEEHHITEVDDLITAWDTFTKDLPGESLCIHTNGKDIYDIPDMLKDYGIYLAGQREE